MSYKRLSTNQVLRQENRNLIVSKLPKPASAKEETRREMEKIWKEKRQQEDDSLYNNSFTSQKTTNPKTEYNLDGINKVFIWNHFNEITNSGSRNNEPRARFKPSVDVNLTNAIKEKIIDNKDLLKYFMNQEHRRNQAHNNKNLGPTKQPI
jgi:hypothetical protein